MGSIRIIETPTGWWTRHGARAVALHGALDGALAHARSLARDEAREVWIHRANRNPERAA